MNSGKAAAPKTKLKASLGARKSAPPIDGNRIVNEGMSVRLCMSDEERALSICVFLRFVIVLVRPGTCVLSCFVSYFLLFFLSFSSPCEKGRGLAHQFCFSRTGRRFRFGREWLYQELLLDAPVCDCTCRALSEYKKYRARLRLIVLFECYRQVLVP